MWNTPNAEQAQEAALSFPLPNRRHKSMRPESHGAEHRTYPDHRLCLRNRDCNAFLTLGMVGILRFEPSSVVVYLCAGVSWCAHARYLKMTKVQTTTLAPLDPNTPRTAIRPLNKRKKPVWARRRGRHISSVWVSTISLPTASNRATSTRRREASDAS